MYATVRRPSSGAGTRRHAVSAWGASAKGRTLGLRPEAAPCPRAPHMMPALLQSLGGARPPARITVHYQNVAGHLLPRLRQCSNGRAVSDRSSARVEVRYGPPIAV